MLVYLHFATAIRRVVGCGRRRPRLLASYTTWLEYEYTDAPLRSVNFVMSKVNGPPRNAARARIPNLVKTFLN